MNATNTAALARLGLTARTSAKAAGDAVHSDRGISDSPYIHTCSLVDAGGNVHFTGEAADATTAEQLALQAAGIS